jgi:hypothetical protein
LETEYTGLQTTVGTIWGWKRVTVSTYRQRKKYSSFGDFPRMPNTILPCRYGIRSSAHFVRKSLEKLVPTIPPHFELCGGVRGYGRLRIAHEDVPSTHRKSRVPEESTQHDTIVRNRTKPGKGLSYTQGVPFLGTSIEKKSDLVLYTRWTHAKTAHIWIYETRPKSPTILTRINSGCRRNMHAVPKHRSVLTYYQLADGRVCTVPPILE